MSECIICKLPQHPQYTVSLVQVSISHLPLPALWESQIYHWRVHRDVRGWGSRGTLAPRSPSERPHSQKGSGQEGLVGVSRPEGEAIERASSMWRGGEGGGRERGEGGGRERGEREGGREEGAASYSPIWLQSVPGLLVLGVGGLSTAPRRDGFLAEEEEGGKRCRQ